MSVNQKKSRKTNRWKAHDYSLAGAYFVTICTHERESFLGSVVGHKVELNDLGKIVESNWLTLPDKYSALSLGEYQIMPNHLHAIVFFSGIKNPIATADEKDPVMTTHELSLLKPISRKQMMLSKAIGFFKMNAAKAINIFRKSEGTKVWQRSFHDRVIRDYEECCRIERYIQNNPINWANDPDNIIIKRLPG